MQKKKNLKRIPASALIVLTIGALAVLVPGGLTACSAPRTGGERAQTTRTAVTGESENKQTDTGNDGKRHADQSGGSSREEASAAPNWREKAAKESLYRLTEAIEKQFPGETFTDLPKEETDKAAGQFSGSYYFSGRKAASGWQFVAGVCRVKENPLEGMTCGASGAPSGYNVSQFDGGRVLLMERGDGETGMSYLYDILQHGDEGAEYMMDAAGRGVRLIPPKSGPFLKVSMVKQGIPVNEFVPLTKEQEKELKDGNPAIGKAEDGKDKDGKGEVQKLPEQSRIALCAGREELSEVWSGQGENLTDRMVDMAEERCGFEVGGNFRISDIVQAELTVNLYGESRSETLANKSDLEFLEEKLKNGILEEGQPDGSYGGILTLTRQDGSKIFVQLASEGGSGYVLGNAAVYSLSQDDMEAVWSAFTRIDGWKEYGGRIRILMDQPAWDEDTEELNFVLENETGKPIQYILSPIFYKKSGEESGGGETKDGAWQQIEGVAGFCGFVTGMDGERLELAVPWKDAFVGKGPGLYKLEIQVMPEPDLRFEVSDYFELR